MSLFASSLLLHSLHHTATWASWLTSYLRHDPLSQQFKLCAGFTPTFDIELDEQTFLPLTEWLSSVYEGYSHLGEIFRSHGHFRLDDYVLPPEVDLGRGHTAVAEDGGRQVESPPQPVVILVTDLEAVDDQLAVDLFEV